MLSVLFYVFWLALIKIGKKLFVKHFHEHGFEGDFFCVFKTIRNYWHGKKIEELFKSLPVNMVEQYQSTSLIPSTHITFLIIIIIPHSKAFPYKNSSILGKFCDNTKLTHIQSPWKIMVILAATNKARKYSRSECIQSGGGRDIHARNVTNAAFCILSCYLHKRVRWRWSTRRQSFWKFMMNCHYFYFFVRQLRSAIVRKFV